MATEIPKYGWREDGDHWQPGKPCWSPVQSTDGTPLKPIIRCMCGHWVGIGLHHVHSDGTVTASFYHKKGDVSPADPEGCEWHVWLKLLDYDGHDFPPQS